VQRGPYVSNSSRAKKGNDIAMTRLATQPSSRTSTTAGRRRPYGSGSTTATRGSAQVSVVRRRTGGSREPRQYRLRKAIATATIVAAMTGGSSTSTAGAVGPAPYSAHSMVYTCCTPRELKERAFAEAQAMGSAYIRVDVEIGPIFEWGGWRQQPDWSKLDEILDLSGQYQLPVLAVLRTTPAQLSTCPNDPNPGRCAPTDHERYGSLAAAIASHARGVIRHWEALNEPDRRWDFHGTASDYAWTLRRTYDAIKSVAPEDQVLIGGITSPKSLRWLSRVFATPGADALRRFDIANVHLRGTLDSLRQAMTQFRAFFSGHGFHGPLWVTEHGYPGATRFQRDPHYRGGEPAQARYLRQSIPALVRAGAGQVFVTLRDSFAEEFGDSKFVSEGVLHIADSAPYQARRKPAFALTRRLSSLWPTLPAAQRDRDE
jgi:hypothetical protein